MTGRVDRLQKNYAIGIRWTAFPLHTETPEAGRSLEDLFAGQNYDMDQARARMQQVAAAEGLPLGERTMTYNSRRAQELGKWAEAEGRGDAFHHAMFRAYFADVLNIALIPVLVDVTESVGLSGSEARMILEEGTYRQAVDQDWQRSFEASIRAVPTFMVDRQLLTGAQSYEAIEQLLITNGAERRH